MSEVEPRGWERATPVPTGPRVFAKRPCTVEAWQWDGSRECAAVVCDWVEDNGGFAAEHPFENLILLGDQIAPAKPTDWIVRDKFGEFWPLGDDVFHGVYQSLL